MTLSTNFNVNPYYDDFDEDKKFLRTLFKPGYAVQARELTQIQTTLQDQVGRFGNHIFKNGSIVNEAKTFFANTTYIKLDSTYAGADIVANNFIGKTIVDNISLPTKKGQVIKVFDADAGTGDPITLMVQTTLGSFGSGNTIATYDASSTNSPTLANISSSGVGAGQVFSITEGLYYYDGFFIKVSPQTVAVSKYTTTGNARVGLEVTESIVEASSDTSLLDPAQNASNYQAPGADRYKIDLILATRSLASDDDEKFIEIARVEEGSLTTYYQTPIYSVLEETLARRTFDESGNYTVKQFQLALEDNASNTANLDIVLSPGKAYVYGYEFETIAPTRITIEKPRQTEPVANKRLTVDYGEYVFANNFYGSFPINSLQTVDLHCVSNGFINVQTVGAISNTRIGTARIKSLQFDSSQDSSNAKTYEYKTFLFDIDVGSIVGSNCNNGIAAGNTTFIQIANTLSNSFLYSTVDEAYTGAKFRVTAGPGVGELPKTIINYKGSTQTIQLAEPFVANVNSLSTFAIDFEFNDVKSLLVTSGTTKVAAADIDDRSKDYASQFYDTTISESQSERNLIALGDSFIKEGTIGDISLSYRRLYQGVTFSSNESVALAVSSGESISSAGSTSSRAENYQIIVTTKGAGTTYNVGDHVPATSITSVDTATRKITVTGAGAMTANIIATIDVSNPTPKTKTYISGNTTHIQTSGGLNLHGNGAVQLFGSVGQIYISANNVVKTYNTPQNLYTSDVLSIAKIYDFNGATISQANFLSATDVTNRYKLFNGQKDSYYDHASIQIIPGKTIPSGPLVVMFNQFVSSGAGFFTVDSYINGGTTYENIPTFLSKSKTTFELRDVIDFRPVRANATVATANSIVFDVDSTTSGPKIFENGSDIILDYQYYLPRIDKVILNKNKTFEVIKGVSSSYAITPKEKDNSMHLYTLRHPPYVLNKSNTNIVFIENKRYTMRDIGTIEKRVGNLEYYTSLSLLEQNTLNRQDLSILDTTNTPRFKNGIITDSFIGTSIADVYKSDYSVANDPNAGEIRPTFNVTSYKLTFTPGSSSNYTQNGVFLTVSSSAIPFAEQTKASKTVNVNPFNIINYLGKIELNPKTDIWIDTERQPDVLVNLEGDRDAWAVIANSPSYEWNDWQTIWSGTEVTPAGRTDSEGNLETRGISNRQVTAQGLLMVNGRPAPARGNGGAQVADFNVVTTSGQVRSGVASTIIPRTITQSIGDKIVDVSIIPFMREASVLFNATDFKPNESLFAFFDNTPIDQYVARANKFLIANTNLQYQTQLGNPETVTVFNNSTATSNGTAIAIRTSNNELFVVNIQPSTALKIPNANLIGSVTGVSQRISGYEHYSGNANSATVSSITLRVDASNANNEVYYANTANSNTIYIVSGTGAGQQRTMNSYVAATRTANITSNWTTTPDTTSVYSIGRPTTNFAGDVVGIFNIPKSTFRIGEKQFRLIDNQTNDVGSSSTNGDASFFAQGLLQKVNDTIISATVPGSVQRVSVNDEQIVTTSTTETRVVSQWYDPLAQTFLSAPNTYPNGIFINRIRFCFKTKDDAVPVTLQIRPTVNGYPSYAVIYPYATVTLTPDKVKTTDAPDLDNPTKYTEFVFDTPIYMQTGEHSFVLLSNSNKYEVFTAEIGKLDIVSSRQISEQPYNGVLFLSQNGSTWTADQTSDMMFRIYRSQFSTTPATTQFNIVPPSSNVKYDLINMTVGDLALPETSINYNFNSIVDATSSFAGYKNFVPGQNYDMNDGQGRRVLTTNNNSFSVQATMSTQDPSVSPVIDTTRFGFVAIENIINEMPLLNTGFEVVNGGSGYANTNDVTVTISGGNGSGATARANVVGGVIDAIILTNDGGSNYTESPTITLTPGSGGGSGASVTYNGEDKKSGGNSLVRYMHRVVTLADGFHSEDLRVYLTAYKPSGSNIYVYYKLLSDSDPDDFDDKNYQLMTQLDNTNFTSSIPGDYREFSFAPGINNIANNSISYTSGATSYRSFQKFAIKIVMSGNNPVDVPKVRDFRAIALPSGE